MATFSTNQNRQFYVALAGGADTTVTEASAKGTIGGVKVVGDGPCKELYFLYKGADTVLKSDRIQLKNLDYLKLVDAKDLETPLKSVTVALDANVNSGAPVSGQDYILRINLRQFFGMSDEDQYFKDACVHATSGMTAAQFYTKMVESLNLCFSREVGATKTSNPYFTFSASGSGISITEKEQSWTRGVGSFETVMFDVIPTTIYVDGDDVQWGTVTVSSGSSVGDGKKIADLEYFCLGERGDQYRMIGFPNYIPTDYMVDPSAEYHVLDIHYAFTDSGVSSYRSEKDITIVSKTKSILESIKTAIEEAVNPSTSSDTKESSDDSNS